MASKRSTEHLLSNNSGENSKGGNMSNKKVSMTLVNSQVCTDYNQDYSRFVKQ